MLLVNGAILKIRVVSLTIYAILIHEVIRDADADLDAMEREVTQR